MQVQDYHGQNAPKHKRTRNGCLGCKRSRVKCLENKPSCSRCLKLAVECIYPQKPARSAPYIHLAPLTPTTVVVDPRGFVNQATYNRLGPSGCLYLAFFYSDLVPRLEDPSLGSFWTRTVLREGARNDCILDAIVGIAALARAANTHRKCVSLSKADMSGCAHYATAVKYNTRAISKFRQHISTANAAPPRAILIMTILFIFYERLHGNEEAVGHLTATATRLLKDVILRHQDYNGKSLVSAPLDDEGVLDAEYLLPRTTIVASRVSPVLSAKLSPLLLPHFSYQQCPRMPGPAESLAKFHMAYWRFGTIVMTWDYRYTYSMYTGTQLSDPTSSAKKKEEQTYLLLQADAWRSAAEQRLSIETSTKAKQILRRIVAATRLVRLAIYCCADMLGFSWDEQTDECREVVELHEAVLSETPISKYRDFWAENSLSGLLHAAFQCRDYETRTRCLRLWRLARGKDPDLNTASMVKGCSTVIELEEASRNEEGIVPSSARYFWVNGTWDADLTRFSMVLGNVPDSTEHQIQYRCIDFGVEDLDLFNGSP